ncbi:receptor-type tyrosine-protein phosphatase mu-like isoform X4 [Tenebrio molitor]|uniref:receptor-type tyrosine-protein phosphatase mu-like isoform X4 n=1 Tax=Tenebrio molitor TaxID=7067 RepID=UPI003624AA7B
MQFEATGVNVFFLILVINVVYLNCQSSFFMVHNLKKNEYYCITNSTHALSWLADEKGTQESETESQFIPHAPLLRLGTEGEDSKWTYVNRNYQRILDRRWETIPTYKTVTEKYSRLQFINVEDELQQNFQISLSIRISRQAHIFLCDGDKVEESNCYWFLLMAFGGTKTELRKCARGTIPVRRNIPAHKSCETPIQTIMHNNSDSQYLTNKEWRHFELSKKDNRLSFRRLKNKDAIIQYDDGENVYSVTHMMIHSKETVTGLWKIHKVPYFYTNYSTNQKTTVEINPKNGVICLSLFVKMCSNCKIILTLSESNNESNILKEETYSSQEMWKEIKLFVDNVQTNSTVLFISTITNNQRDLFWNIDPIIRECHNTEYRMIKSNRKLNCQLISKEDHNVISLDDDAKATENNCIDDDTVTRHCVPCRLFLNQTCGKLKICEKDGTQLKCSCTAGWKYPTCYSSCDSGFYGMNCKKRCGHCSRHSCHFVNGICDPCSDNYVGAKCDIPPGQVFSEPPVVSDIKYSEAKVKVENFELLNKKHIDSPDSYYVEYKKAEGNSEWMTPDQRNPFNKPGIIKLQHLEPNTKYIVRGIIITINNKTFIDENLPHAAFTTKCYEIKDEDFISNSYNTSIRVTFKSKTLTQFCNFTISLIGTSHAKESSHPKPIRYNIQQNTIFPLKLENDTYCFKNLTPYTNYQIIVKKNQTKLDRAVRTIEGVPGAIVNLGIKDIRDSSARLTWQSPENFNGQFVKYVVRYQLVSHKSCKTSNGKTFPIKQLSAEETDVTVSGLVPYAKYSFSVSAWNRKIEGPPVNVTQDTFASDTISDDEIPELKWKIEARSVKLHYSSMACSIMRGSLQIRIKKSCSNEWCDNFVEKEKECDFENTFCLVHVIPYSDYTFNIKFCRNSTCAKTVRSKSFQTLSDPPNVVRDLTIFSKNENSISIRWMPPYPPTGKLDLYKVTYEEVDNNNNKGEMETFKDLPCTLWPGYQCITLSRLEKIKKYSIKVQAKNEHPNSFGQTAVVVGTPKIEPSKKPNNLTIHWNLQNDFELTWGHPNETSGLITFFNISVLYHNSTKNNLHDSFPVTNYKPFYEYKIEEKRLLKSTPFRIRIEAFNGYNGEELVKNDTSPPALPLFSTEPKISTSNDTITIEISPIKSTNRDDTNKYELFLFLLDENFNNHDNVKSLTRLQENHHVNLSKFKILYQCQLKSPVHFKIGQDNYTINDCNRSSSSSLKQATTYNVTILLTNTIENKSSYKLYSYQVHTLGEPVDVPQDLRLLGLLSLLLIIPIAIAFRKFLVKSKSSNNREDYERNTETYSKPVKITKYPDYVKNSLKNDELVRQHKEILNTVKIYETIIDDILIDYLDTEYIDGQHVKKSHLAAKVPEPDKFALFWKLIWQENIKHIILLDNHLEDKQETDENYWHVKDEDLRHHKLSLTFKSCDIFFDYECRKFILTFKKTSRHIVLYRYCSWWNTSTSLFSLPLMFFFLMTSKVPLDSKSPILVQCSTGVEGTGLALLCDISFRTANRDGTIDIFKISHRLAKCDPNLINNINYYLLAHFIIFEYCFKIDTTFKCDSFQTNTPILFSEEQIHKYFKYVQETQWLDTIKRTRKTGNKSVRKELSLSAPYCLDYDDVSACFGVETINCFRCPGKFTITKEPTPDTLFQFWNFVGNKNISVIVSVNKITLNRIWPDRNMPQITLTKKINLVHRDSKIFDSYDWITVQITIGDKTKIIEIIVMKNWSSEATRPENVADFVNFCNETNAILKKSNSVLVMSHNGIKDSGLYIAMLYNIKKIEVEGVCDVPTSVRMVRNHSPEFRINEGDFTFLFEATENYLKEAQLYEVI